MAVNFSHTSDFNQLKSIARQLRHDILNMLEKA